jgi:hypothetical protein
MDALKAPSQQRRSPESPRFKNFKSYDYNIFGKYSWTEITGDFVKYEEVSKKVTPIGKVHMYTVYKPKTEFDKMTIKPDHTIIHGTFYKLTPFLVGPGQEEKYIPKDLFEKLEGGGKKTSRRKKSRRKTSRRKK